MIFIWLPKRYLARALDSSAMAGEATCSLSCIQITIVLFIGSLIFKLWPGGWWVDSATSLVLGLLFFWEGYKMIRWVRDPDFDGGCCKDCRIMAGGGGSGAEELGERYRDLCDCCTEKSECRDAGECRCIGPGGVVRLDYRLFYFLLMADFVTWRLSPVLLLAARLAARMVPNAARIPSLMGLDLINPSVHYLNSHPSRSSFFACFAHFTCVPIRLVSVQTIIMLAPDPPQCSKGTNVQVTLPM
jgi:hypothetical protein